MLNIFHIETNNFVNGIGNRFVIWLQGCNLGCPECWNKQTWSMAANTLTSVDSLLNRIENKPGIKGVTFTGGEPFLQAKELSMLARLIKEKTELSIHIFTGYELNELADCYQKELLKYTDTLVTGRFDTSIRNNNQKTHYLNAHSPAWGFNNSDVEIDIDENNNVIMTGYPTDELVSGLEGVLDDRIYD
ncbi:MAG: radical SAM protein [Spirochaetales bacterium]|nr:radical SAM protein [Spirochaetales bacterium]